MENAAPSVLQRLRAADIIRMAGLKVASLGQEYCRIGAVQQPQRHINQLKGFVHVPSAQDIPVEPAASTTNHADHPPQEEIEPHRYTVEVMIESATEWHCLCTCNTPANTFCTHAAALLYQWLAHPFSFLSATPSDPSSRIPPLAVDSAHLSSDGSRSPGNEAHPQLSNSTGTIKSPTPARALTPLTGVTDMLAQLGLSELRTIAREYDVTTNGLSKAQLVEAIVEMLRQPEMVRRMAATLEKPPRQLLAALALAGGSMLDDDLRGMFERFSLGQPSQLQNVLTTLQNKGLLLRTSLNSTANQRVGLNGVMLDLGWFVPSEVRAALRITVPSTTVDVQRLDEQGGIPNISHHELPDLLAALLLIARTLDGYRLGRDELRDAYPANTSITGNIARNGTASNRSLPSLAADGSLSLTPPGDTLADSTFDWLQQHVPYPRPLLRFAARLLRLADILYKDDSGAPNLHVLSNATSLLLGPNYSEVARDLFELWLAQAPYDELSDLQEEGLRLRCRATAMNYPLLRQGELNTENSEARQTVVALLAQAPLNQWLSFSSFARFLYRLNPLFLQHRQRLFSLPHWWLEREEGRPLRPLQLSDWLRGEYYYLARLIRGPLHWWGICDIAESPDGRLLAFRLTAQANWFFNGLLPTEEKIHKPVAEIRLQTNQQHALLVPCSINAWPLLHVLEDFADMAGVQDGLLRYHLSPSSLSNALGHGLHATVLLETLHAYGIPETLLAQYERWIASFGRVRLYTQVALLETTDTIAMRELSATTSLHEQIVHTIHPTLHILKYTGIEYITAELKRRGQTPLLHHEEPYGTE